MNYEAILYSPDGPAVPQEGGTHQKLSTFVHVTRDPQRNEATYSTRHRCGYDALTDQYLDDISSVPGVVEATLRGGHLYDVHVAKAVAFSWEEVEPRVLDILRRRHEEL